MRSKKNNLYSMVCQSKYVKPEELEQFAKQIRKQGKSIVTLNGSFDLMHAGHLQIIYEASLQADILLVALNTDSSIKEYKDSRRPIVPLEFRLQLMAALAFVDYVTWFDETDPIVFLEKVKPDVHVNGADYGEECIEAKVVKEGGGKIHIAQFIPGLSTSELLKKIQNLCV